MPILTFTDQRGILMAYMPDSAALLEFEITVAAWRRIPKLRAHLQKAVLVAWQHLPRKFRFPVTATLLLAGDSKLKQLNHDFRGLNKPTNVLSFPQFSPAQLSKFGKQKRHVAVGDIALAYTYSIKEAKENNKLVVNHITHLVIHGFLHLFGYDHMLGRDADLMEKLEIKIMKTLGLPNPYATFLTGRSLNP